MQQHRILHCLRAPVGGLFRHVRDLAREQARRGHAVGLICEAGDGDPLTQDRLAELAPDLALGLARLAMPREIGKADVSAAQDVRAIAQAVRADVIHGHGAKGGAYTRLAARSLRRRGIDVLAFYTPHGGSLHYHPATLKGRLFMAAERYLARHTDGLIFESIYAAETYAANAGVPACPKRVIHNGITASELAPVTYAPDAADFVFVGELRRLKGVDVLLEATAAVNRDRPCSVTIVGAGPDAAEFKALSGKLGLDSCIAMPGAMPAREAFKLGRALVMPSRAESLPYVALEAAGAGLALIATDVGGVPEIVEGTDTKLVPPGDAEALAQAMRAILDDPDGAKARAEQLKAAISQRFTIAAMAEGVLRFYADARLARHLPVVQPMVPTAA
ncbi:MAG: glycosyltransferase family 4 protein [Hyphomicrobiaceae bacterium]